MFGSAPFSAYVDREQLAAVAEHRPPEHAGKGGSQFYTATAEDGVEMSGVHSLTTVQ